MLAEMPASSPSTRPPDPLGVLGTVGPVFVLTLACVVVVAVASDLVGWKPLASRWTSLLVLVVVVLLVAGTWLRTKGTAAPGGSSHPAPRRRLRWLLAAPSLVLVGYAVGALFLSRASRVEWFLNGDHVRHLVLVADIQANGALSYDSRIYPRAWHTAVALLASVAGVDSTGLLGLIDVMATATWLLSALVALTTATLTFSVGRRAGLAPVPACLTGALGGAATLWPSFLGHYQALGLESSLIAAVVLAVCLRELLERLGSLTAFLVCAAGLTVMGHTWQLLLPVSGAAALVSGWVYLRAGRRLRVITVGSVAVAVTLVVLPSLTAVATTVGVGHAAVADIVAPVPVLTLVGAAASVVLLAWRRRADVPLLVVLALVALPAITSFALAARVGVSVTTYYPAKLLWHSALLGLAAVGAVAGLLWSRLGEARPAFAAPARALMGAVGALCALGAVYAPSPAFTGAWSTADGATVLSLVTAEGAERATVVWSDGRLNTDAVTRIVLDAYRPEDSRVDTAQQRLDVEGDCRLLEAAPEPVILSNRPEAEVRARYGCAPDAVVLGP